MEVLIHGFTQIGSLVDKQGVGMPMSVGMVTSIINSVFESKTKPPMDIVNECASLLDVLAME